MGEKVFLKGNEAAAESAIRAGCRQYYFYPLTPQSEVGEYMSTHMEKAGGVALQVESEIAAINMVFGAAASGQRAMTSSSGCGISLMTEAISYLANAEMPCVLLDVMRGGPGLGGLSPTQADYFQFVKGGGHGGYKMPVYAPGNGQELVDFMYNAFEIGEKYRTPVGVLIDGVSGQTMEQVELPDSIEKNVEYDWELTGAKDRKNRVVRTGYGPELRHHLIDLYAKYAKMEEELQMWEEIQTEDAELILVAFGIAARICKTVVKNVREQGLKVGLIRPQSLWPFPKKAFRKYNGTDTKFLTIELSEGQMIEDVILAIGEDKNMNFYKEIAGETPTVEEIIEEIKRLKGEK